MERLNKAASFQISHLWKRSLQTKHPNSTVTMVKHTLTHFSPLSLLYSVWVYRMEAGRPASPWRCDLRSSSVAAFQHKRGQPGLKSHSIQFSCQTFRTSHLTDCACFILATSSYQEDGVFDVCYSAAHLLHPFSQLQILRGNEPKVQTQKKNISGLFYLEKPPERTRFLMVT